MHYIIRDTLKILSFGRILNYRWLVGTATMAARRGWCLHRTPAGIIRDISKFLAFFVLCTMLFFLNISSGYSQSKPRAYYLNNSGSDKNPGSKRRPFKTIQRINKVKLRLGDSVLLKGDQVYKGTLTIINVKPGITKVPLYISSYGEGVAIIDGDNKNALIANGINFLQINSLRIKGSGRKKGNNSNGVVINNCSNVSIADLAISGFQKSGLLINSSSNVIVSKVHAFENGRAGILIEGQNGKKDSKNILIKDCLAENNPGDPTMLTNHSGNGILVGHSTSVKIEYCVATNNGWDMPRIGNGPVGIWCYESDSISIQYCISFRNKTSKGGDDGGGFDLDGGVTNSVIRYCLSYENQGSAFGIFQYAGASPWNNNTISNNISENDGVISAARASAYIWNSSNDAEQFMNLSFYKNILFSSEGACIHYAEQSNRKLFDFHDNLFIGKNRILVGDQATDSYKNNSSWIFLSEHRKDSLNDISRNIENSILLQENPGYKTIGNTITDPHKLKLTIDGQLSDYLSK
ncbi:MAG: right-handed parallel beta-helix repeat-containing protein [Ginsengibacter sp.]